ncbi:MAG: cadmium-translocating P-type ATPase [Verrucomicrobia bacterium]|nr:cadmium-translocating P-type ATPase [Verrucomicrobiota bacterium]
MPPDKLLPDQPLPASALFLLCYLSGGYFGVIAGFNSLRRGVVDVDLLMVLAALGAAWVGAPFEGGMLLFLFALSNVLQNRAMDKSRQAIQALMRLRPETVKVLRGQDWVTTAVDAVQPGDKVRIHAGDSIALDGELIRGETTVDESTLTGEAMPVLKTPGSPLFAGTLNGGGSIDLRVTRAAEDSTLARIVRMVEEAQSQKANTQCFLEKAEQRYALGVILITLGLILVPWLLLEADFDATFYRAMTVMVVASPCALIISTPAAFLSAIGGAAKRGLLFKGGVHLERMAKVDIVAFDKTGTLTCGKPKVLSIQPASDIGESELLTLAAGLEAHANHPLAAAVLDAASARQLTPQTAAEVQTVAGHGLQGIVQGRALLLGSPAFLEEQGLKRPASVEACRAEGQTVVVLAEHLPDNTLRLLGVLGIADEIRPDAAATLCALKRLGVKKIALLTGDHPEVARRVAKAVGADLVFADLKPEDKVTLIKDLALTGTVAMVGDGVNDAPALASAHVGIAMGAAGTDVAMETADVVLMSDTLSRLPEAFALGRRTRRIVIQNLVFAMGIIVGLGLLALFRGIPLPLGVIAHEGSTVLVCLNGLRLLRPTRLPRVSQKQKSSCGHCAGNPACALHITATV